jgi:hypothetical protein
VILGVEANRSADGGNRIVTVFKPLYRNVYPYRVDVLDWGLAKL